jgi:hypothetical protein
MAGKYSAVTVSQLTQLTNLRATTTSSILSRSSMTSFSSPAFLVVSSSRSHHNNCFTQSKLFAIGPSFLSAPTSTSLSQTFQDAPPIEQLSPTTTIIVFIVGITPFLWATYEFWRRIAFGESFGTGSDSVVIPRLDEVLIIGEDNNPNSSRGRRTLDKGALTVAYVLFAVAAGTVAIAVASIVTGPQPNM